MAPKFPGVFIDPLDPADFTGGGPDQTPSFTQDVMDIIGNAGDATDGFDELLVGAGQLIDGWDAAAAASDADLDAVLTMLDTTKPDSLDTSLAGYVSTVPYGVSVLNDATQLAPPQLLEFPLNAILDAGGITAPAVQTAVDLGVVKLGAPAIAVRIGMSTPTKTGPSGVTSVTLFAPDTSIWKLHVVQGPPVRVYYGGGNYFVGNTYTYTLLVTPAKIGAFSAQLNAFGYPTGGFNVVTYTVTVVA